MHKQRITWPKLVGGAFELGLTASTVIGLRLAKLARGGTEARRESALMVEEKVKAAFDASAEAARSIASGKAERVPERILDLYRKRVAANVRRLAKKPRGSGSR